MVKFFKSNLKTFAGSPETLIRLGELRTDKVRVTYFSYNENQYREGILEKIQEVFPLKNESNITWVNIDGVHDGEIVKNIGEQFNLHPLLLEDIMNTEQRSKIEDYENYLFVVLKMIYFSKETEELIIEQISLLVGNNYVISFQERRGDVFDLVRDRIRGDKGRIRKMGADYLAYSLIDTIVDNYFLILETLGETIEDLEDELIKNPTPETLQTIHVTKREMIFLRKSIWPLREIINFLQKGESPLVKESTQIYLRDLYDHTIQIIDTIENFRDMVAGMLDIYLSSISNKMNEIMKVLTIIATIFIPLTFIAGIYGMNFDIMPELRMPWGYFMILAVMLGVGIIMLLYFHRKRWL